MSLCFLVSAAAPAVEVLEKDYNKQTFDKFNKAEGEFSKYKIGDHYEWTLYGARYDQPNYGHRFEWSKPGLSSMSICLEVDPETGGKIGRAHV